MIVSSDQAQLEADFKGVDSWVIAVADSGSYKLILRWLLMGRICYRLMRFLVIYQSVGGQCGWFSKGCPICNEFIEE